MYVTYDRHVKYVDVDIHVMYADVDIHVIYVIGMITVRPILLSC